MTWSNNKIESNRFKPTIRYHFPVFFKSIRSSDIHTSSRTRECFSCPNKINKGEKYISHQFRYDKKIISIYFHTKCW